MSNQLIDKALAYIGENIQQPIVVRSTNVSLQLTYAKSASIIAPTVSGYKFKCWINCATSGWVGSVYVASPTSPDTTVWNATHGTSSTANGNVSVYALYIRSDLA